MTDNLCSHIYNMLGTTTPSIIAITITITIIEEMTFFVLLLLKLNILTPLS